MKKFVYIVAMVVLLSCNDDDTKISLTSHLYDTISFKNVFKELTLTRAELINRIISDSSMNSENSQLKAKIDTLLKQADRAQNDELELLRISNEYKHLMDANNLLKLKLDKYVKDNDVLIKQKKLLSDSLASVSLNRRSLQISVTEAGRLAITSVQVVPYGFVKKNLFHSFKRYQTYKASEVKQVVVYFTIPTNKLASAKTYKLVAIINGTAGIPEDKSLQGMVELKYTGLEYHDSILFNKQIEWRETIHNVSIKNENIVLWKGDLKLN